MVRKALVSTALAAALAIVYFSAPAASEEEETARVVPIQQCPKPGLCPYVKRIVPDFFHHPTVYAHTPAIPHYPHYPHYPPLQHYFPLPIVPSHGGVHHQPAHPPAIVVHNNPHHEPSHGHAPSDGHHAPPHHVERRDEAAHNTSPKIPHHIEASLCGNLCIDDSVCPGLKKCCPTECGYSCFDPVHIAE